jgi:hypothetical protein
MKKLVTKVILTCTAPVLVLGGVDVAEAKTPSVSYDVQAYEDGSGRVLRIDYVQGRKRVSNIVSTEESFFLINCNVGPIACTPGEYPNQVAKRACQTFVVARRPALHMTSDLAITNCTDGKTTWRKATDEDVEGEVL